MRCTHALVLAGVTPMVFGGGGLELIWSDEFDDLFVNPSNWEFQIGDGTQYGIPGWGNNELQYYTSRPVNARIEDGALHIIAQRENYNGFQYTSARLRTMGRFSFLYGRVEARIQLPSGEGLWPALWMLPESPAYGGWAASGELDIMEASDDGRVVFGTIHYGGSWPNNRHRGGVTVDDFWQDYHVYAIEWEPDQIRWYIDDQLFHLENSGSWFSSGAPGNSRAPFDQPFHLLINMAVGGNFTVTPGPNAEFPKTLKMDWIRVYHPVQQAFGGVPRAVPGRIEAEDFDEGWNGQAYYDVDPENLGGAYRLDTGVDIEVASEGGYNVGWIRPGEWIEYTIDVQHAGLYRIEARVASQSTGGPFRLLFDGEDVGATFFAPPTGGWQNWTTVSADAQLPAGETVMRFENLGGASIEYNVNWYDFVLVAADCPADLAEPFGILDLADIAAFAAAFVAGDPIADLAEPFGVFDLADVNAFVTSFTEGCP